MNYKRHIAIIILSIIIVYINCLGNGFVWDDSFTVVNNDFIKGHKLLREVFSKQLYYFANTDYLYYRPFQSLTNMFDYFVWGLNPFGFHLTNLLLHLLAAVLVYFFVNLLSEDSELSFFTSLLFSLHPVNRSPVNHITSRSNILLAIFVLSSLILFLKAKTYKGYILSLVCYIFALLSKETVVVFPLCLILVKEMYKKYKAKSASSKNIIVCFWYGVFLTIPAAYILLRTELLGIKSDIFPKYNISLLTYTFTFLRTVIDYLRLIFLGSDFYMLRTIDIVQVTYRNIVLYSLLIIIAIVIMMRFYRLNKLLFLSLGMFFILLLPVASLSLRNPEYYFQGKAIIEEHWLYLAAIGIFILVSFYFKKFGSLFGKYFYKLLFLGLIIYLSFITFNENKFWKDNFTIFTRTIQFVDNSFTMYSNLGKVYMNKRSINKAIEMYSKALQIKTNDDSGKIVLYKDIAFAYFLNNQTDQAIDAVERALSINHNYADGHACLGLIYSRLDLPKAKGEWRKALDIDNFNSISFDNLLVLSNSDHDIRDYMLKKYEALPITGRFEDYKIYRAKGLLYLYNGVYSLAIDNLARAIKINPYDVKTNNALAVYYAQLKDFKNAIKLFKATLRLNPYEKEVYRNFALLYNQLNQKEEANRLIEKSETVSIYN